MDVAKWWSILLELAVFSEILQALGLQVFVPTLVEFADLGTLARKFLEASHDSSGSKQIVPTQAYVEEVVESIPRRENKERLSYAWNLHHARTRCASTHYVGNGLQTVTL